MGVEVKECRLPFRSDGNVVKLMIAEVRELCEHTKSIDSYGCRK